MSGRVPDMVWGERVLIVREDNRRRAVLKVKKCRGR